MIVDERTACLTSIMQLISGHVIRLNRLLDYKLLESFLNFPKVKRTRFLLKRVHNNDDLGDKLYSHEHHLCFTSS